MYIGERERWILRELKSLPIKGMPTRGAIGLEGLAVYKASF